MLPEGMALIRVAKPGEDVPGRGDGEKEQQALADGVPASAANRR